MTGRQPQGEHRDDGATPPGGSVTPPGGSVTPPGGSAKAGDEGGRTRWLPRVGMYRAGLMRLTAPRLSLQRFGISRLGLHRGEDPGGKAFAAVTILPTLLLVAWLVAGLPLLVAGRFLPVPMVLISVPVAVGLVMLTRRYLPGRWPGPGDSDPVNRAGRGAGGPGWHAWLGLAGTVVVAVGFAVWQFQQNSPQFIVSRDPGAYFQLGYWIAEHGSLPIPPLLGAFGGSHPGLTLSSLGFAGNAGAVAPRLAPGLPMVLAAGLWIHSLPGGAAVSPLLGAFAVLTVGGLTGRLAGPHWAPAGAFLLALTLPEMYTSRSAFPQIFAQVLLFGGLCMVVDSLGPRQSRLLAALGGLAMGLTVLVQVGSLGVLLPTIVFIGALLAARKPQAFPLYGGLLVGAGCGLAGGFLLAEPMMSAVAPQLGLAGLAAAGFVLVTLAGAAVGLADPLRRRAVRVLAAPPLRWLPEAGAVIVAVAAAGLFIRPYLQTVRDGASTYVAALQRLSELPVDPRRLYAEDSLYWVIWYLGTPALLLGVAGLALLPRRCMQALITWRDPTGTAGAWAMPLMIIGWGTATVLWRPDTVPDQPWASRQLVPVLLPGLIVAAVWVSAWMAVRARERGAGTIAVAAAVACFVAALAVPSAVTTLGIGRRQATPSGPAPATSGLAFQRTGTGEEIAVRMLCGAIPARASVVFLDSTAASEFTQVVRGVCGVPAAVAAGATQAQVDEMTGGITRVGRYPVLLATNQAELTPYQLQPRKVLDLTTAQDAHLLTQPPASTWPVRYVLWMSGPGGTASLPSDA